MNIKRIIDISKKIYQGMAVWPGDAGVKITRPSQIKNGDLCNVSVFSMGVHTGTHIDAPLHFLDQSLDIGSMDLSRFIGSAKVFEVKTTGKLITENDIKDLAIGEGDIVLFKTQNSDMPDTGEFYKDYIALDASAARYLADKRIKTLGVDYLSIDTYESSAFPAHYTLLSQEIGIIEGLNLKDVTQGSYFFSCLPLNLPGADGSPARAVLIEYE